MTMISWMLGCSMLALTAGQTQTRVASTPSTDHIAGFSELLAREINRAFQGADLAKGTGYPVEPGYYVSMTKSAFRILDAAEIPLKEGRIEDGRISAECRSQCPVAYWNAFSKVWRDEDRSHARTRFVHPRRILWAAAAGLPAQSLIQSAYAALETWPQANLPALYLLFDAGPGGIRARQFRLLPPGGVNLASQQAALELRIRILPKQVYELSAHAAGFAFAGRKSGLNSLSTRMSDIKRRYPGKRAVVIELAPDSSVQELAEVMDATLEIFPDVILSGLFGN